MKVQMEVAVKQWKGRLDETVLEEEELGGHGRLFGSGIKREICQETSEISLFLLCSFIPKSISIRSSPLNG